MGFWDWLDGVIKKEMDKEDEYERRQTNWKLAEYERKENRRCCANCHYFGVLHPNYYCYKKGVTMGFTVYEKPTDYVCDDFEKRT